MAGVSTLGTAGHTKVHCHERALYFKSTFFLCVSFGALLCRSNLFAVGCLKEMLTVGVVDRFLLHYVQNLTTKGRGERMQNCAHGMKKYGQKTTISVTYGARPT